MPSITYQNRSGGNELIPEGKVALQVIEDKDTKDKYSSNGNPMINLRMQMVGFYDETRKEWIPKDGGGKLFEALVFTEKAAWKVDSFLNSSGHAPQVGTEINLNAADTIGWVVYANVVHEESDDPKYPVNPVIAGYIKEESEFHPRHRPEVPKNAFGNRTF